MNADGPLVAQTAPAYKDRRTGLLVFGILKILLGAFFGLMVPLMILGMTLAARAEPDAVNLRMMIPGVAFYLVAAVVLIWLGIGSIKARRWARALTLILAWFWLATGVVGSVFTAVLMPKSMGLGAGGAQGIPPEAQAIAMATTLGVLLVGFILIPGALVLFYRRADVKTTCEALNPTRSWTDTCPLPVLALSLLLWVGGGAMLLMPLCGMGVLPLFGALLGGWPAGILFVVVGIVWVWAGWAAYRQRIVGWWVALVCVVLFGVSATITFARVDVLEMYRLMGYTEKQLEMLRQYNFQKGATMVLMVLGGAVPWILFLLWVRKYFQAPRSAVLPAEPPAAL